MKILGYIIPKDLQSVDFVKSLYTQAEKKGELTKGQIDALKDILEIEEEFFHFPDKCPMEETPDYKDDDGDFKHLQYQDYYTLLNKLKRNRFKKVKKKNQCVRALQSYVDGKINYKLIEKALNRDYRPFKGYL